MNDVMIDGIKYVPVTKITKMQIELMRKVLKGQEYLSDKAIDSIILAMKQHEDGTKKEESSKKVTKTVEKPNLIGDVKFTGRELDIYSADYLKKVDSDGHLYWHRGKGRWTIHDAISIRSKMKQTRKLSNADVKELSIRLGMSVTMIKRIMYNIQYGDVSKWVDNWIAKYSFKSTKSVPVQNNPQKRKEMNGFA